MDGGLKLIDLQTKDLSLKAGWVDRLLFSQVDLQYFKSILPCPHSTVWKCNIKQAHIYKIMPHSMAREIWLAWSKFNFKTPVSSHDILNQVNSFILSR